MTSLRRTTIATPKYNTQRLTLSQVNSQTGESQGESTEDEKLETEDEEFGQDTDLNARTMWKKRFII